MVNSVGTTSIRVEMRRRIVTKHKNKANKEESENTRFNEVRQFVYVLGAERERVLLNQSIIGYNIRGQLSLFI